MKFPFVSRAMHAEVVKALVVSIEHERENVAMLRRQFSDLAARYHALRQQGYQPAPERVAVERQAADEVTRAINIMCRGDRRLRADMLAQVQRDRAAGLDDATIAANVLSGQSSQTLEDFVS